MYSRVAPFCWSLNITPPSSARLQSLLQMCNDPASSAYAAYINIRTEVDLTFLLNIARCRTMPRSVSLITSTEYKDTFRDTQILCRCTPSTGRCSGNSLWRRPHRCSGCGSCYPRRRRWICKSCSWNSNPGSVQILHKEKEMKWNFLSGSENNSERKDLVRYG